MGRVPWSSKMKGSIFVTFLCVVSLALGKRKVPEVKDGRIGPQKVRPLNPRIPRAIAYPQLPQIYHGWSLNLPHDEPNLYFQQPLVYPGFVPYPYQLNLFQGTQGFKHPTPVSGSDPQLVQGSKVSSMEEGVEQSGSGGINVATPFTKQQTTADLDQVVPGSGSKVGTTPPILTDNDYNFNSEIKEVDGTEVVIMRGSFTNVGADGQEFVVDWYADETGFHPTAVHSPSEQTQDVQVAAEP